MLGILEDFMKRPRFHDLAVIHHNDFIGDVGNDPKIVRDHEDRHAKFGLQVLHQFQNLRLDRDIQRSGWFVSD